MLELSQGCASIRQRMSFSSAIKGWLLRNRTSVRMAFVLRMIAMGIGSFFSLLWWRLLQRAMGDPLLGLFQNFQGVARLGNLGDFGISGALSLKSGLLLGSGDEPALRKLLASARSLYVLLSGGLCLGFIALSPWLPHWLNFEGIPGAGSMTLLFVYGGLSLAWFLIGGYFASLNYAMGTVTWPVFPSVIIAQIAAPFFHWRLALLHAPLWVQNAPYLVSSVLLAFTSWKMLSWSHPWVGKLTPLGFDRSQFKALTSASLWAYLINVGTAIFITTDRLVIGAGIGQAAIPRYLFNYKACELWITLIVTAAFVGLPKITQWISSPDKADRQRLLTELSRLSTFEIVITCVATLGYLAFNNLFIRIWLDKEHQAPLAWQVAFACNLAVTCGGNAGIQIASRAGNHGLKLSGLAIAGTGLVNLALSILSVKLVGTLGTVGAMAGVAIATVIAQSISSIYLGSVTCRYLGISVPRWTARCWLLPVAFTIAAATLKERFPDDSFLHLGILSVSYVVLLLVVCRLAGMNLEMFRAELAQARALLAGK
jgi:hypothetical protein